MTASPPAPEDLLPPRAVAALLRVDPRTVARWEEAGLLTAKRTKGGHRRFLRSDVEALAAGEVVTIAEVAALWRVSHSAAARWAQEGKFPGATRTLGGHWRIPRAEAEAGLAGG